MTFVFRRVFWCKKSLNVKHGQNDYLLQFSQLPNLVFIVPIIIPLCKEVFVVLFFFFVYERLKLDRILFYN